MAVELMEIEEPILDEDEEEDEDKVTLTGT